MRFFHTSLKLICAGVLIAAALPASRMGVASATDPGAADSEVRVFVR